MVGRILGVRVFFQWMRYLQKLRVNARNSVGSAVTMKMKEDNKHNNNNNHTSILYSHRSLNPLVSCWVFSSLAYQKTPILMIIVKICFSTKPSITKCLTFTLIICIIHLTKRSSTCWLNYKNSMEKHTNPVNYSSNKNKNKIFQKVIRAISCWVTYSPHL